MLAYGERRALSHADAAGRARRSAARAVRALRRVHRAALRRAGRRRARPRATRSCAAARRADRAQADAADRRRAGPEDRPGAAAAGGPCARALRRRRVGRARARGLRDGRFADELVQACADLVGRWHPSPAPAWVTAIPSRRSGDLVPDFARRLAAALGVPYADVLERTGDNPPQREMENSAQQVANVRGQFRVTGPPPGRPRAARRRRALLGLDAGHGRRRSCG